MRHDLEPCPMNATPPDDEALELTEDVDGRSGMRVFHANRAPTLQEVRGMTDEEVFYLGLTMAQLKAMTIEAFELLESRTEAGRAAALARLSPAEQWQARAYTERHKRRRLARSYVPFSQRSNPR
jgi:hypothetical protein